MASSSTNTSSPSTSPSFSPVDVSQLPHRDLGPALNAVIWSLTVLATAFLALRVYCKLSRRGKLWWDDDVLILAWTALVIANSFTSVTTTLAYGNHIWDIAVGTIGKIALLADISGTLAILAAVWSKTSFAVTLLRITQGWTKAIVWWAIITMNVAMHITALLVWVQCTPVEKSWNPLVEGHCLPIRRVIEYNMFSAAYSAGMDILLALLPWKIVWSAQLKQSERFGVAIAMSMGIFAGITAFVKVTKVPKMQSDDMYDGVELIMWSIAEIAVTIMAASVPTLRVLLTQHRRETRRPPSKATSGWMPKYRISSTDNFELQTRNTVIIESGYASSRVHSQHMSARGKEDVLRSRQSIEEEAQPPLPAAGKIVRTSVVTVEFGEQKDDKMAAKLEALREGSELRSPRSDDQDFEIIEEGREGWKTRPANRGDTLPLWHSTY